MRKVGGGQANANAQPISYLAATVTEFGLQDIDKHGIVQAISRTLWDMPGLPLAN